MPVAVPGTVPVTAPLGAAGGQFAVSAFCFCFSRLLPSELSSMRDAGSLEIASNEKMGVQGAAGDSGRRSRGSDEGSRR